MSAEWTTRFLTQLGGRRAAGGPGERRGVRGAPEPRRLRGRGNPRQVSLVEGKGPSSQEAEAGSRDILGRAQLVP